MMTIACTLRALAICATWACLATSAQTITPLTDFKSGPGNGVYSYASSTPATVGDLMQASRPRPAATARGELVLPPNAAPDAKLPP
ncbi:MAG: hypothetical protein IPI20_16845 [Rhodoferax sp.]|nr:hypothetical protein [Rhodoferax sp.]